MTHCPSMTWALDVSLLNDNLTWHWNTHCMLVTHIDDLTSDIHCTFMTWHPVTHYVLLMTNLWLSLLTDDLTWHLTFTVYWWLDVCSLTMYWWRWRMTPCCTMTHCSSMTWRLDVSLIKRSLDLTLKHCVLVTYVDDLTSDNIARWWLDVSHSEWHPVTHYVLMTLTYDTLLHNDSMPIHDLTSWRLTTQRWLDLTLKHPLHVSDLCWWLDIRHSLCIDDLMSAHSLTICWWLWRMTLCCTMPHCLSMTWHLDVSLLTSDLTWHSNTHYVLMTHVDDLTFDIHCILMTWCPLTHYVLMTLTYDILRYNDSLPIHDLTSWRLTTQRWLDIETPTAC